MRGKRSGTIFFGGGWKWFLTPFLPDTISPLTISPLAQTNTSGSTSNEYVYFNGARVARRDLSASGNAYYYYSDGIGTARMTTNTAGAVCYDADYGPFGYERVYTNNCSQNFKFAGMERDSETGNDHTWYRNYEENLGRWMSPDSVTGDVTNPQSLNLYPYVLNDPTTLTDTTGLCGCGGGGGFGFLGGGGGGSGWGGGCGGGGFGGGGGGGGHPPRRTLPIPGPPTVSVPGGSFPNPFTPGDQPPSPWFNIIINLPMPPWPPVPPGAGGGTGFAGLPPIYSVEGVYCECFRISEKPAYGTCEFLCNCTSAYFGTPTIGVAAFFLSTLQEKCGPIHNCPDMIQTTAPTTFLFGIAVASRVYITACVP